MCGPEDLIRSECPKLKKLLNKQGKIQVKINLIREHQINSKEKELISELDFESENSNVYCLNDNETEEEEICKIREKEENQLMKTSLNLENLVEHLESKVNPYNF